MRPQLQVDMAGETLQRVIQAQHLAQQKELYKRQFTKELYRYSAAGLICPLFCMAWYWLNRPEGGIVWDFLLLGSAVIVAYTLYWLTRHRRAWVKLIDQEMYRAMISTTARLSILLMLAGGLAAVLTVNEFGAAAARACLLSAVLVFASTTLPAVWDRRRAAWLVIVWTVRWLRQQRKMVARLDDKLLYAAVYTDSFVVLLVSLGLGVMGFYDAAGGSAAAVLSYATAGGSWAASGVTFGLITLPAYQGYRRLAAQKGMG